jgi:hypothetical protein
VNFAPDLSYRASDAVTFATSFTRCQGTWLVGHPACFVIKDTLEGEVPSGMSRATGVYFGLDELNRVRYLGITDQEPPSNRRRYGHLMAFGTGKENSRYEIQGRFPNRTLVSFSNRKIASALVSRPTSLPCTPQMRLFIVTR